MLHCRGIRLVDLRCSNEPSGVTSSQRRKTNSENTLATFVCVEQFDSRKCEREAILEIERHARLVVTHLIVAVPFAHPSKYLADSSIAIGIGDDIAASLRNDEFRVEEASLGTHKALRFALMESGAYGHPGSIVFRTVPDDAANDLARIAGDVGLEKAKVIIDSPTPGEHQNNA